MVSSPRKSHPNSSHDSCLPPLPPAPPAPPVPQRVPPPPPSPPATRPTVNESYSPVLVILFGGLAVSFCFICYLICATRYLRRRPNNANTNYETREDLLNEELGPITLHSIWLINTIGLDQSQIESIQLFKYKRDEKLIEDTDCSVCLSEFEDDESLRLLPKCSHAFHVPCIDTWLRSHKNCPLCRAPIFNNTNDQPNMIASSTREESETETIPVNDAETIDDHDHDHHVIEVDNSGEMVKTSSVVDETSSSSAQGEELVAMRRSISNGQLVGSKKPSSMRKSEHKRKGSNSSIRDLSKVTKTSSFALPLRKASSFTSKSRPLNQSY